MAASLVGGALLSAAFNVLLERLTPELTDSLNKIGGKKLDDKLLHRLKPSLIAARAVLNDAELKQFNKDEAVKDWLDELKDAVYDLEDLIDEISTRAATQKQVPYFSFASLNLRDTSLANKLEAITDRIEYIVGQKDALNLKKSTGTETLSWRPPVTSHVNVSEVYGRKKEKEDIIKLMFNGEGDQLLSVIPIVGIGGVGKTTLVQSIYNDKDVKQEFDLTIWVCVSEAFDLMNIAQTIIKSICPDFVCDNMGLNLLQLHLAEKLGRKKFLMVLDDVWNDKYTDWDTLKKLLENGVEECKVIVTTRLESVALMVKTIPSFYRLNVMSDKDCLSIFSMHAFHVKDSTMNSRLEKIGGDVARKCNGLPLAAKVLGGLFRSKPDFEDWNNILKDALWDSLDNEIIPALRVSYYYLPPHLKQCFAYCSLYPEDYQFEKDELKLMWMAEGFLQPSKGNMTLEEVGDGYFDDLVSRSFFQPPPENDEYSDGVEYYVMHDLIHELASHIARDFYLRLRENRNKIGNNTRHLSCHFQNYQCLNREVFHNSKGLRTFIGLNFSNIPRSIGNASLLLSSNLKYLRTLSLQGLSALKIVPVSIGELIHLRYLDLSVTCIESLPDSICNLFNLQTLELWGCTFLKILPSDMQNLVNLRHFNLSDSKRIESLPDSLCKLYNLQTLQLRFCQCLKMLPSDMQDLVNLRYLDVGETPLKEMPRGLGNLKELQFLSDFIVSKQHEESGIRELGRISNLKGHITIKRLENVKNVSEAQKARMMEKKNVEGLTLSWSQSDDTEDTRTERDILVNLQPHWDLKHLTIEGYRGTIFPEWLGSPSYHNMTNLRLINCQNCCMLPPLGQLPALTELSIYGLERVVSIGDEFLKGNDSASIIPFPSLEILYFGGMTSWEQWHPIDIEAFPKLQSLDITGCDKFNGTVPCRFPSLETLQIASSMSSNWIEKCPRSLIDIEAFPKLRCLRIERCDKLEKLQIASSMSSNWIEKCSQLQDLEIDGSGNMVWQVQEFPPSLCTLRIRGSHMLESILEALSKHSQLQELVISNCSDVSPPLIHLPSSLQHVRVESCKNANFMMSSNAPLQNVRSIYIDSCNLLKFMSDDMEGLFPNLKELDIVNCHMMESLPVGILVPSLKELRITCSNSELILSHQKWHLLSNITHLSISYPQDSVVKCFPEGCFLPTTLTALELKRFYLLETLNCTGLQHLTSLQQLKITRCPKLDKMSGEKLPSSLTKLHIWDCPLLEKKYFNKDEELLNQIAHIPLVNLFRI